MSDLTTSFSEQEEEVEAEVDEDVDLLLQIWIPCFDDLDQLSSALHSIEPFYECVGDRLAVYVIDGRYATFDGERDLTEGAMELCGELGFPIYTHPPELPLGGSSERDGVLRTPQHSQATWVNYELLEEDVWTLEMDTDERLRFVDFDFIRELDPQKKYTPQVLTPDNEQLLPAIRLYKPKYWTFWIDDVCFWREFYPRDTSIEDLYEAHMLTSHRSTGYGGQTAAIKLRNYGRDRPEEFRDRRAEQMARMGVAPHVQRAMREGQYPSLVSAEEQTVGGTVSRVDVTEDDDDGDDDGDDDDGDHLKEVPDGSGCAEVWDYLSEDRQGFPVTDPKEEDDDE